MARLFSFFSFAVLTQFVLLLNQVVLLPIQLRHWGTAETASWYAAIALAAITTFADLGLRTAGHVELLQYVNQGNETAGVYIKEIWAWIRLLVWSITLVLIAAQGVSSFLHGAGGHTSEWKAALMLAYAIETLLIVRIVFLDSLGHYSGAEATYFVFAVLRLGSALPALLYFHIQPPGLAWLFLITSVIGIALQGRMCRNLGVLGIFDPIPKNLSLRGVATARYTMAEPLSNWLRISLPVLVIAAISTPAAVTCYVALRAVFGASRTTIQQVARVASVEYLRIRASGDRIRAENLLIVFVQGAGFLGAAIAAGVVIDNLRILSLWLPHFDSRMFQAIVASFAAAGAFYAYQIFVSLMFRVGELGEVSRRQYAFVLYSGVFALCAIAGKSLSLYLVLIVLSELLLSTSFLLRFHDSPNWSGLKAGRRGLLSSLVAMSMVGLLWLLVRNRRTEIFVKTSLSNVGQSIAILCICLGALSIFQLLLNLDLIKEFLAPSLRLRLAPTNRPKRPVLDT